MVPLLVVGGVVTRKAGHCNACSVEKNDAKESVFFSLLFSSTLDFLSSASARDTYTRTVRSKNLIYQSIYHNPVRCRNRSRAFPMEEAAKFPHGPRPNPLVLVLCLVSIGGKCSKLECSR